MEVTPQVDEERDVLIPEQSTEGRKQDRHGY